ncbi:MAG: hypothetical protein A2234_07360 [Elusimicrobia bacterium RIFOXYA2_FULL_58_8]|nr:MAG: hypothetical protein A2234_07360 [Elusimicrobia bacterium RIFOXYA2_FULL_58_8]OGS13690.1 MAG: hypothetical protein A2285_01130 [Elusimicrobia bacterium RIFOXYA12_FULL_57_11]
MTTKINLVLSLSLNVMLTLVILGNNKKPVALADFRDAVSDTPAAEPLMETAPAVVMPPLAAETPLVEAARAAAVTEEPAPPQAVIVGNDWAAYKQEMLDDKDVLVSNIFRLERNATRAMNASVNRLQATGKEVLFSCLMPATGGGTFYLIRLVSAAPEIPRMASRADLVSQ